MKYKFERKQKHLILAQFQEYDDAPRHGRLLFHQTVQDAVADF